MNDRVVEVWPENHRAFDLFWEMQTQWRVGFAGPTGLDYGSVYHHLDDLGISAGDERRRLMADIRLMERAALEAMHPPEGTT